MPSNGTSGCQQQCGVQYSDQTQAGSCSIPSPPEWPAFLQIPASQYRAVSEVGSSFPGLADSSCQDSGSCPVTFLYTGKNQSLAQAMASLLLQGSVPNTLDPLEILSDITPGTTTWTYMDNYIEPAILSIQDLFVLPANCSALPSGGIPVSISLGTESFSSDIQCLSTKILWRDNYSTINNELYQGFWKGNPNNMINEISVAYDFGSTTSKNLDLTIGYNSTYKNDTGTGPPGLVRVSRSMNLVILTSLVYEKQYKLRMMMKMHGLSDGPYWFISYSYFLAVSIVYMFCFILFGSIIGLNFFRLNSYSIQAVFYFVYMNLQIALGFLASTVFSNVKTATVVGYQYVFGFGLLGNFLFEFFVEDTTFSRGAIFAMELLPGFSLYRGLFEFSQYAFIGNYKGTSGMKWSNLNDSENGLRQVLGIMAVEWFLFLPIAYYLDQVVGSGDGLKKSPLFFLDSILQRKRGHGRQLNAGIIGSHVNVQLQKHDVSQEREAVDKILSSSSTSHAIVCDDIKKVYPGKDGNPGKYAVRGLSLAIPRGECFGMLGPNGAGKTTSINMMTGLLAPTSGTAFIQGLDIRRNLNKIYSCMGVCPQHDLLWETLTGREHLLFYGRLKNLKGAALKNAVESSLKSVNLFNGGVGDKQAGKYSGGMKRRLSVAISLIGDPRVVYMDEPSTGLDPASRKNLWDVVRQAKQDRAIILTTHSMEEAEILCDRLGIFVNGELQCIGNSKELKSRYGGSYVFSITTTQNEEGNVSKLVWRLSPNAKKVYSLSGTQKFELPKSDVRIADVFRTMEYAKKEFTVQAWGFADTTLEDVFIKVASEANAGATVL